MPPTANRPVAVLKDGRTVTNFARRVVAAILICFATPSYSQSVPNVHPPQGAIQLTPLWSRLGDINGEAGAVEVAVLSPDAQYVVSGRNSTISLSCGGP